METEQGLPTTDLTELINQIQVVARAREKVVAAKKARHDAQVAWEESNASLFQAEVVASGGCAGAESLLRDFTIEAYNLTGNKQPVPGVGIRETTKLEYDPKVALNWGIEHHGIALKLDTKAFETVVKATPGIVDFVTTTIVIQATIAKELEVTTSE